MQDDNLWHYRAPNDKEFFLAKSPRGLRWIAEIDTK